MPSAARRNGTFRISARIVVVGLWTVLFGMFILLFAVQMVTTLSSASSIDVLAESTGTGIETSLLNSLVVLFRGGILTLAVGGLLMVFGTLYVISVAR